GEATVTREQINSEVQSYLRSGEGEALLDGLLAQRLSRFIKYLNERDQPLISLGGKAPQEVGIELEEGVC
ncbi:hypothetical protein MO867_22125, partial [Microbulbifer sp. OS29]